MSKILFSPPRRIGIWFFVMFIAFFVVIQQDCYAQDSVKAKKILVVEQIARKKWQPPASPTIFKEKDKVTIVINGNDEKLRGQIEVISDSLIIVEGHIINLSDIKSIKAFKGVITTLTGFSSIILSFAMLATFHGSNTSYYEDEYAQTASLIVSAVFAAAGGAVAVVGLINVTSAKNYRFDSDYKMCVMSKEEFDKKQSSLNPTIPKFQKGKTKKQE